MSEISGSELVVVAVLWLASAARVHTVRAGPAHRALFVAITALALSMTARVDVIAHDIDQVTGIHGAGVLIKHVSGLIAVAALFDLAVLGTTTRIRRHGLPLAGLVVTTVTMTALFWAMPRDDSADFADRAAGHTLTTWYILIWTTYLGVAMALSTRLFHHGHTASRNQVVRAGQLMLTIGCAIGTGYALYRLAYFAARLDHGPPARGDTFYVDLSDDIKYLAILFIAGGLSTAGIPATRASLRARRHLRALQPLWQALVPANRRLDQPGLTPRDRLTRHTVELYDAIHVLHRNAAPHLAPLARTRLAGRGLVGDDLDIATYVCVLRATWLQTTRRSTVIQTTSPPLSADPASGLAWLLDLAHLWDTPAVNDTLADLFTAPEAAR
ncbi:MAB_1171c family putative transporter [Micromonospora sp. NPDC049107]|uniref:MAB_1171c family putative transporter n=1 Tax=unclassified Micromonospora TaxID=2617518 RepID=UPI0033F36DB5